MRTSPSSQQYPVKWPFLMLFSYFQYMKARYILLNFCMLAFILSLNPSEARTQSKTNQPEP